MTVMQANGSRALIAAAGTGGHVYPALAVAGLLVEHGWSVDWVGTDRGIEQRVVPDAGIPLHHLTVSGLRGKSLIARLAGLLRLFVALVQSLFIMRKVRPDVVLGMGGYAAGPAGLAAWLTRRPLVIHEQNAVAGTTNRWLAPLAKSVLCGLPGEFAAHRQAPVVGNPIRNTLNPVGRDDLAQLACFSPERPLRVLVLGGSLGAAPLNALMPPTMNYLIGSGFEQSLSLWQQCGERNRAEADAAWQQSDFAAVQCDDFIDDMAGAYRWSDVVIARAGALTVSELAATGTASILIPLPHAIDDHQTANARVLSETGAAVLMPQAEATPERLARHLMEWITTPARLAEMAASASNAVAEGAAGRVKAELERVAHGRA